jgi:FkbM family methyltransferase
MDNAENILIRFINQLDFDVNTQSMCVRLKKHADYPSILAIADILRESGIDTQALKFAFDEINSLSTPFIVYLSSNNGEFALVDYLNDEYCKLSNNHWDNHTMPIEHFKTIYGGVVLVLQSAVLKKVKHTKNGISNNKPINIFLNTPDLPGKVTYMDIGASYGLPAKWEQFVGNNSFELIMVEPDLFQANEIRMQYPKAYIIPYALGNKKEKIILNITFSQSCSSVLEPDFAVMRHFPLKRSFKVVDRVEVDMYRFDDLVEKERLNKPNFVKIDVQGFEYEVLEGFGEVLNEVLCIELECHLMPIYKNQKTLFDINNYLKSKGFYLRYLEDTESFKGEAVEFNAYFIKRTKFLASKNDKRMIKFWKQVNLIPKVRKF